MTGQIYSIPEDFGLELAGMTATGEIRAEPWSMVDTRGRSVLALPSGWVLLAPRGVKLERVRPAEPDFGAWQIGAYPAYHVNLAGRRTSDKEWCMPGHAATGVEPVWMTWGELWTRYGGDGVTIKRMVPES